MSHFDNPTEEIKLFEHVISLEEHNEFLKEKLLEASRINDNLIADYRSLADEFKLLTQENKELSRSNCSYLGTIYQMRDSSEKVPITPIKKSLPNRHSRKHITNGFFKGM